MTAIIASILFAIFLLLSSVHFYWALGGKWGGDAVLPIKNDDSTKALTPTVLPTLIVAVGLLSIGLLVLAISGLISFDIPRWLKDYGLRVIAGIFFLRAVGDFNYIGFFKKVKQTKFGRNDTTYFSPLCLTIGLLTTILELYNN
ncbi:DUF3995 domain-containing protein [Parapedobacter deserti]|uniref:DUF3995 domain-containing protein n=1 Tax=Parapedobacter deserti TaxID=1912957 RepID=A0ABV7JHL8_9SPHI